MKGILSHKSLMKVPLTVGGTPLDNIDLTNVKNWLNQGAANN